MKHRQKQKNKLFSQKMSTAVPDDHRMCRKCRFLKPKTRFYATRSHCIDCIRDYDNKSPIVKRKRERARKRRKSMTVAEKKEQSDYTKMLNKAKWMSLSPDEQQTARLKRAVYHRKYRERKRLNKD